ncbi:MAG TPA: ABC transporter ATP-binding protein [Pyrinomonadaceae bacterium]|nr:ABC transporter ATP-binding protein [Pyrinomonadaceae bacterium]
MQQQVAEFTRAAVIVEGVVKTYPVPFLRLKKFFRRNSKPPVEALRGVSLTVKRGEIFGLIGRNGAGKTTLTKIIATLVQPTAGTVTVNGFDSVRDDEQVRSNVGLAGAEERSFYWRLTGEQNLIFFARLYGMKDREAKRRIAELFDRFELGEASRRRFGELSTGNKQRLAVARALLPKPPVLLLDEPTRSLDPLAASRMRELIAALAQQDPPVTILFTSHNLGEVETLCNRVAIISKGVIKAIDSPKSLRSLTTDLERIHLTLRDVEALQAQDALSFAKESLNVTNGERGLVVSFSRRRDDKLLDRAVRSLQQVGATVIAIESEQPTLLDVLERYEAEDSSS